MQEFQGNNFSKSQQYQQLQLKSIGLSRQISRLNNKLTIAETKNNI